MNTKSATPNIQRLVVAGHIWTVNHGDADWPLIEYIGKALDSTTVSFGICLNGKDLRNLEKYFEEYPTPAYW